MFLDKDDPVNRIYCVKAPESFIINYKNENIGRDNFKVWDEIFLKTKDEYFLKFKSERTYSGNKDSIDDQSIFLLLFNKDDEYQYIEFMYKNKVKKELIYLISIE